MNRTEYEIFDQYKALSRTIEYIEGKREEICAYYRLARPERILYIGCGSSYSVGCSAAMTARRLLGIEANCLAGGDLMIRPAHYAHLLDNAMLIPISRSGKTHEILRAIEEAKKVAPTLHVFAVTCAEGSPLSVGADFSVDMPWAFDESVCQTRSVANLYAAAQLVSAAMAEDDTIAAELKAIAAGGEDYMRRITPVMRKLAGQDFDSCFVLSDGETCGVAEEAALAMTEIAYTVSQHKRVLDVRHGPIILVEKGTVVLVRMTREGEAFERALVKDLVMRGATVVVCSDTELPPVEGVFAQLCFGARLSDATAAIPLLLPMQLLAYYVAVKTNHDPDHPEGLSAWIKLS